jgi:hypothetical protein
LFGNVFQYGVYLTKYHERYLQLTTRCFLWIKGSLYLKEQKKLLHYGSPKERPWSLIQVSLTKCIVWTHNGEVVSVGPNAVSPKLLEVFLLNCLLEFYCICPESLISILIDSTFSPDLGRKEVSLSIFWKQFLIKSPHDVTQTFRCHATYTCIWSISDDKFLVEIVLTKIFSTQINNTRTCWTVDASQKTKSKFLWRNMGCTDSEERIEQRYQEP